MFSYAILGCVVLFGSIYMTKKLNFSGDHTVGTMLLALIAFCCIVAMAFVQHSSDESRNSEITRSVTKTLVAKPTEPAGSAPTK